MLIRDSEIEIYSIEEDIWVVDTQTGAFKQSSFAA
ncbi:hypothetical protein NIES4071_89540 [Calothrix sp. NIES-4071]|nr:hypothetical protein NIES4071_89540 [Calothrix sp. NIES-4071]BAZ63221.1 hypothetical protein NIES4105_89470 [Calothrix sp. NIES-4105]